MQHAANAEVASSRAMSFPQTIGLKRVTTFPKVRIAVFAYFSPKIRKSMRFLPKISKIRGFARGHNLYNNPSISLQAAQILCGFGLIL
jgi:hypothetical protein